MGSAFVFLYKDSLNILIVCRCTVKFGSICTRPAVSKYPIDITTLLDAAGKMYGA
jgi:hypothetical protein